MAIDIIVTVARNQIRGYRSTLPKRVASHIIGDIQLETRADLATGNHHRGLFIQPLDLLVMLAITTTNI